MKAIILGKPIVGRLETLQYAAKKFNWSNCVIGISSYYAFWAWILGRLLGKKVIYYCIDYYTYRVRADFLDGLSIWLAAKLDKFLCHHVDMVWDISERINYGRMELEHFCLYRNMTPNVIGEPLNKRNYGTPSKIVPLSYPPEYFGWIDWNRKERCVFVGLVPYGKEFWPENTDWIGNGKLTFQELMHELAYYGIGISIWDRNGNNYYGDPGKTKLYSAIGIPVIMTDNTSYAEIIRKTEAGIIVKYTKESIQYAADKIFKNYEFYKNNVKKTWEYINADNIFSNFKLLE